MSNRSFNDGFIRPKPDGKGDIFPSKANVNISVQKTPISQTLYYHDSVAIEGVVHVFGGNGDFYFNKAYDPATDTWSSKLVNPSARSRVEVETVGGKAYLIGGTDLNIQVTAQNQEYDPVTNTFSSKAAMTVAKQLFAIATLNDKIYCMNGLSGAADNTNYEYTPSSNTWATKATSGALFGYSQSGKAVNGKIYTAGGTSNGTGATKVTAEYDPGLNTWQQKANMPYGVMGHTAQAIGDDLFIIGGVSNNGIVYLSVVLSYNQPTNSWVMRRSLLSVRDRAASAKVGNKIYVSGGYGATLDNTVANAPLAFHEEYDTSMEKYKY